MKLISINIKNFRSIEEVSFEIHPIYNGYTYSLIGVNESGKSSFLKAISAVRNNEEIKYPKDYFNSSKPIEITLNYELLPYETEQLEKELSGLEFEADLIAQVKIKNFSQKTIFEPISATPKRIVEKIDFQKNKFSNYSLDGTKPVKKNQTQTESLNLEQYFDTNLPNYFGKLVHNVVLWKSETRYLINDEIDLVDFSNSPNSISVPLLNCFALAGILGGEITKQVEALRGNTAAISNLQDKLSDSVTAHIKKVWADHPIKVKFQINFPFLSFLVEDDQVRYQAKTTDQRSDGFRQFISFLLTISAESATKKLTNSLLLLDEPETHLHPQAQEYLMNELIKITMNNDNNIVMYATHSNHMIAKNSIERCYRVTKEINEKTKIKKINLEKSTYAEVNYEVFGIAGSDYHNELYGYLEAEEKLSNLPKTKKWKNIKTGIEKLVSLSEYIRHSIHHPENTENEKYSDEELKQSIEELRKLKLESY